MNCKWHACNKQAVDKPKGFCSSSCKNNFAVDKRRKKIKELAVEYKGGKCKNCGYNKCIKALEFHHRDPTQKDFGISAHGLTKSWEKIKLELDKCDMLCSNCHKEEHEHIRSQVAIMVRATPC